MLSLIRMGVATVIVSAAAAGPASAATIVFSATSKSTPVDQLFRVSPTGAGLKQLTTGVNPADAPAISPNGKEIAFERSGIGIFTMSVNGGGIRRLTTNGRDGYPAWSPDGKDIAFVRPRGPVWRVYIVPANGGRLRPLTKAPPAGRPSWTSAGLLIPSGGDLLTIAPANGRVLKYYGANIDVIWGQMSVAVAPSISKLTYVGSRTPEPGDMECGEGPCQRFGLYIESLLTKAKNPSMVVKDSGPATFSPDSRQILFVTDGKLTVLTVASGAKKAIATGSAYPSLVAPPAWH